MSDDDDDMSDGDHDDFGPSEMEAYDWVMKFASGKAKEADLKALRHWMSQNPAHRATFERVREAWVDLGPVGKELSRENFFSRRKRSPERLSPSTSRWLGRRAVFGGIAAASAAGIAVLAVDPPLGLWPSWSELHADYRTTEEEQRRVVLASGASIAMNTRTSIALRPSGGNAPGIELIAGEAMVVTQAAAPSPFIVIAGSGRVVAATARFNLWRDDRSVCVTCLEGAVAVEQGGATLSLGPSQQVVYSGREIGQVVTVNPEIVTSWMEGVVIFHAAPIAQVIEAVNRYRPGRIILTNAALGRRELNARFRIQDIGKVVSQIQLVFGAQVTNLPGGVVLLG